MQFGAVALMRVESEPHQSAAYVSDHQHSAVQIFVFVAPFCVRLFPTLRDMYCGHLNLPR
jgi:hypothetical protein